MIGYILHGGFQGSQGRSLGGHGGQFPFVISQNHPGIADIGQSRGHAGIIPEGHAHGHAVINPEVAAENIPQNHKEQSRLQDRGQSGIEQQKRVVAIAGPVLLRTGAAGKQRGDHRHQKRNQQRNNQEIAGNAGNEKAKKRNLVLPPQQQKSNDRQRQQNKRQNI